MGESNLYVANLVHDLGAGLDYNYDIMKRGLEPYLNYLKNLRLYYKSKSLEWKIQLHEGLNLKKNKGQHGSNKSHKNTVWIDLSELNYDQLEQLFENKGKWIVEYDDNVTRTKSNKIDIVSFNRSEKALEIKQAPTKQYASIPFSTYQIDKQINAVKSLLHYPLPKYEELLKLFHRVEDTEWGKIDDDIDVKKWFVLTEDRDGTHEQKEFVKKALATPDFAVLEGPPGSGKTTVLSELVLQLISQNKRVLFCASTHVAVDNLLERLVAIDTDAGKPIDFSLVPVRIGDSESISDTIEDYRYEKFTNTIKQNIVSNLSDRKSKSRAQEMLSKVIENNDDVIELLARDGVNLACGTTIGILKHPDIVQDRIQSQFDVLIIDEASKTTFQEFLVPALFARRWIIVGDTKQLVPYVDTESVSEQMNMCIDHKLSIVSRNIFLAGAKNPTPTLVITDSEDTRCMYNSMCQNFGVSIHDAGNQDGKITANIVLVSAESFLRRKSEFLAFIKQRSKNITIDIDEQIKNKWSITKKQKNKSMQSAGGEILKQINQIQRRLGSDNYTRTWGYEMAWRIISLMSDNISDANKGREKKKQEISQLVSIPNSYHESNNVDQKLSDVLRIAFPSILEMLQRGFKLDLGRIGITNSAQDSEETSMDYESNLSDIAIINGIPKEHFDMRHTLLKWQYRMHSELASFSHVHVYDEKALFTPDDINEQRAWSYDRYDKRLEWINVTGNNPLDQKTGRAQNVNKNEAETIISELENFYKWAKTHPKPDSTPWRIAVLSFYTQQVSLLKRRIGVMTSKGSFNTFRMPSNGPARIIGEIRTVDSFQGHESDVVFLSMAKTNPTIFLTNLNRLNVAITRARYQYVIVGDKKVMSKSDSYLGKLACSVHLKGGHQS